MDESARLPCRALLPGEFGLVKNGKSCFRPVIFCLGIVVLLSLKKSSVCPAFHKQAQQTESCQPLDLMGVVAAEVVTSAQRSDVTWDAEAIA